MNARLVEIFSSFQGEGTHLGERQTFVRFQGCSLKCRWCDTPENFNPKPQFRVERERFFGIWEEHANPVSALTLLEWLEHFLDPRVSLTGGEPLEQVDFLEEFLPQAVPKHSFLLETGGVLPQALARIVEWIDIVSMDLKLPSSAKTGTFWEEHKAFLQIAQKAREIYVKIVFTEETQLNELQFGLKVIHSINPQTPVILQPASATRAFQKVPSAARMAQFYEEAFRFFPQVRLIPQVHKILNIS